MKAFIIANGDMCDYDFARTVLADGDYILACDGGLHHCHSIGILPNYIIGDMDSVDEAILAEYQNVPIMRFIPEKDETDLELAIARACELKAESIVVLGGLGGRVDHQLANIHALAQAVRIGVRAEIWDEHTRIMLIKDHCRIHRGDGYLVTMLPLTTEAAGITTEGLKFPLSSENLSVGYARGISNEITDDCARISLKSGLLLVIQTKM